jgi:hypothetical protein
VPGFGYHHKDPAASLVASIGMKSVGATGFAVYEFLRNSPLTSDDTDIITFPGFRTVERETGIYSGTFTRALVILEQAGWVKVKRGGVKSKNVYVVGEVVSGATIFYADAICLRAALQDENRGSPDQRAMWNRHLAAMNGLKGGPEFLAALPGVTPAIPDAKPAPAKRAPSQLAELEEAWRDSMAAAFNEVTVHWTKKDRTAVKTLLRDWDAASIAKGFWYLTREWTDINKNTFSNKRDAPDVGMLLSFPNLLQSAQVVAKQVEKFERANKGTEPLQTNTPPEPPKLPDPHFAPAKRVAAVWNERLRPHSPESASTLREYVAKLGEGEAIQRIEFLSKHGVKVFPHAKGPHVSMLTASQLVEAMQIT